LELALALLFLAGFAIGALVGVFWTSLKSRSECLSYMIEVGENLKAAETAEADLFHKQEELRSELEAKMQELVLVREQLVVAQFELKQAQATLEELPSVRDRLDAEIRLRIAAETKLEAPEINLEQQEKLLTEATASLADAFTSLSAEALKSNNQVYLALAKSTFETIHAQAKDDFESMHKVIVSLVAPLKESLDTYGQQVVQLKRSLGDVYGRLDEQLRVMGAASGQLQEERRSLVTALRAPQTRDHPAEMTLRRTATPEHRDFDANETLTTGNRRQRPGAGHGLNAIAAAWSNLLNWLQVPMRRGDVAPWRKVKNWLRYGS